MSDERQPRLPVLAAVADPEREFPFVPGNTAELLVNGARFFPAMLDAMRAARRSITLAIFRRSNLPAPWSAGAPSAAPAKDLIAPSAQ
jgi:phosphatidylserine/phosphatidylglycerophosphate/cardiolipin synthase-like enzyme